MGAGKEPMFIFFGLNTNIGIFASTTRGSKFVWRRRRYSDACLGEIRRRAPRESRDISVCVGTRSVRNGRSRNFEDRGRHVREVCVDAVDSNLFAVTVV